MDMNRRGFLQLLGIAGAVAAAPKVALAELTREIETVAPQTLTQGLYFRHRGIVYSAGLIENLSLRPQEAITEDIALYGRIVPRFIGYRGADVDLMLRSSPQTARSLEALWRALFDSEVLSYSPVDMLAILRYKSAFKNDLDLQEGDFVLASRNVVVTHAETAFSIAGDDDITTRLQVELQPDRFEYGRVGSGTEISLAQEMQKIGVKS